MKLIILTSSALILFLILLRRVLRGRISPTVQYALWLLVAARLLIPGTLFTAPVSLVGAAQELQTTIQETLPDEGGLPAYVLPPITNIRPEDTVHSPEEFPEDIHTLRPSAGNTVPTAFPVVDWLDILWKAGIVLMGTAFLLSNLAFSRELRQKRQLLFSDELPIPCKTAVYVVEDLASPCLVGLIRPAIYINPAALDPQRLAHILTHEEIHLRHGDHLWSVLRSICLAIHWYNPLVWWAAVLSRRDCELSCDSAAIHHLGEESRFSYGQTLLSMILPRTSPADLLRTATTMTGGKRTMMERIQLITREPRTRKIALVAVVAATLVAVVLTFGGTAEHPAQNGVSDTVPSITLPEVPSAEMQDIAAAPLTREQAIALYGEARAIWDWFTLGTLPTTGEILPTEEGTLLQVDSFNSLSELRRHLESYFSPTLAECLLTSFSPFQEIDNKLYILPVSRTPSIYAGEKTVRAFVLTGKEAAQQGYDCHIHSTTQVLDLYDQKTVLYEKRHDWFMTWNGQNYVFTSFGPWDDVDPQRYYNALTILDHYNRGNSITTWYPMLSNLDWYALRATRDQWPKNFDLGMYVIESIHRYITEHGAEMTAVQYQDILSATEGLDGAYSEGFGCEVYRLYENDPGLFARTVLQDLSLNNQNRALDLFRFEEALRGLREAPRTREETRQFLQEAHASGYLYTHSSGFFSLTLPSKNCDVTETSTGITVNLDNESWILRLLTQPSQWLQDHPSQALVLGTFETNGTTQTYLLETADPDDPLTHQIADSFRLHVTADMISALVRENLGGDTGRAIQYLPYLSWLNYREQYGKEGLIALLTALQSAAESSPLSWNQYHDLLSAPSDRAIDGSFAAMYRSLLQTLHDRDPQQFASVLLSQYISSTERQNALDWLNMDLPSLENEVREI